MEHLYETLFLSVITMCILLLVQTSYAQERTFGLGVMLGEPTGFSAKLWTSNSNAFDFGLVGQSLDMIIIQAAGLIYM